MVRVKESESQLVIIGSSELLRRYCREPNLILQDLNTRLSSVFISEMHYQVRAPSESEAATCLKDRQYLPNEQLKHSLSIKKLIG